MVEGATLFFGAGAPPGRGKWSTLRSTTHPAPRRVAPSTVIPGGKAIERCSGLRLLTPACQIAGPVIHEPAPALEQVREAAGGVDLAADLVRQRGFRHLARVIRRPNETRKGCNNLYLHLFK